MKSQIRHIQSGDLRYEALLFVCPGCASVDPPGNGGIHMLPVNNTHDIGKPNWEWDGNLEAPTLSPSILSQGRVRCHSFLRSGVFDFLSDSEHSLAGQKVPIPDLPSWAEREG